MDRWLINNYGSSADLSISTVFPFLKRDCIYGFQDQDKDFEDIATNKLQYGRNGGHA